MEDKDYLPTPEEIKISCENIQKSWSKSRLLSRLVTHPSDGSIPTIDTSNLSSQIRMLSSYRGHGGPNE